jgi:WD40 repeat protein
LPPIEQPHDSAHLALSNDGELLASTDSKELKVWDLNSGKVKVATSVNRNSNVGISPDNKFACCFGLNKGLTVLDITTGAVKLLAEDKSLPSAGAVSSALPMAAVSIIPKVGGKGFATIEVYDLNTDKVRTLGLESAAYSLAFSSDGAFMAARLRNKIAILEVATWKEPIYIDATAKQLTSKIQLAPRGQFVAGIDLGALVLWDVAAKSSKIIESTNCLDVAFRPNGDLIYSRIGIPICIIDPATGESRGAAQAAK